MNFIEIENQILNMNFFILFSTMLLYWFQSALFISSQWSFLAPLSLFFSSFLQTSFLLFRWVGSSHFPLSNLYESLLFLSWVVTFVLVVFTFQLNTQWLTQFKLGGIHSSISANVVQGSFVKPQFSWSKSNLLDPLVGSILTPLILLINTFACFLLPNELKITTALVPALQSNWLVMHVTVMMLSYGALLSGCLLSICYLIVTFFSSRFLNKIPNPFTKTENLNGSSELAPSTFELSLPLQNQSKGVQVGDLDGLSVNFMSLNEQADKIQQTTTAELCLTLDNLSYRILSLGFPLLTIGILSGAVWANQTWGSYWSWDPKETWALITWFVFAIYLHTRISTGWTGKRSAFIASFGFMIIWICYLGVNLLGKGLHSYGFFS